MRRITYILLPIFLLVLAAAFFKSKISADSNTLGKPLSEKVLDVVIDGKKSSFDLKKYQDNNFYLSEKKLLGNKSTVKLTGFENEVSLCEDGVIKLNSGNGICLKGDVGVHSQNIQFVKYSTGNLSIVKIKTSGSDEVNITSDVPSFSFADRNNDGFVDLIVDSRNYDANPLQDVIRGYYLNSEFGFIFDGSENITYNEN